MAYYHPLGSAVVPEHRLKTMDVIKIGGPIVGGIIGVWGVVQRLKGRNRVADIATMAWMMITASSAAAGVLQEIEDRKAMRSLQAQLLQQTPGLPDGVQGLRGYR